MSNNPEVVRGHESTAELEKSAGERSKELLGSAENSVERSAEQHKEHLEKARNDTERVFAKEAGKESASTDSNHSAVRRVTARERADSFKETMKHIQGEMSGPARAFSKAIHSPFVEKSSEILGSSLARPNAVLSGSFTALVLVTLVYVVARTFGYPLSGFETIGAFTFGWILGLLYDYVKIMATGRRI